MELKMRNELATVELEALTADTEKAVEFTERDDKIVLVVVATAATTLTVKAGNSIQGVADLNLKRQIQKCVGREQGKNRCGLSRYSQNRRCGARIKTQEPIV